MATTDKRQKDSARITWDTKPRRAPNPRDIELQIAEIVTPNPARDSEQLQFQFTSLVDRPEVDRSAYNRIIWGDNLLAMQALLAQGYEGQLRLVYIDPPFKADDDFTYQIQVGGSEVKEYPSVLERLAYKDTWSGGLDSYLDMLYPRLQLIRRLLADNGSLYVHLDWHVGHYVKVLLDEVFGRDCFQNEIVWKRTTAHSDAKRWSPVADVIYYYTKTDSAIWNPQHIAHSEEYVADKYRFQDSDGRRYTLGDMASPNSRPNLMYDWKGYPAPPKGWRYSKETMAKLDEEGRIWYPSDPTSRPRLKRYIDELPGMIVNTIWDDINPINSQAEERTGFPTQKPVALLDRIIKASTNPDDLVADFFAGSGTTAVAAERLGRRWITSDLGKVGLQVARARLVQQEAKPFLIENIGNYQREMIYLSGGRIGEMQRIVLKLYGATPRADSNELGTRLADDGVSELVFVGYPDRAITARKVEDLAKLADSLDGSGYKRLVILGWDYEFNYSASLERMRAGGKWKTAVESKTIPPEVYEALKKAKTEDDLESLRGKIFFHEKPYLRITPPKIESQADGQSIVTIGIERYVVFDFPVTSANDRLQIMKLARDNFGVLIDYWAVDWDYDGVVFQSRWQALRTGKAGTDLPKEATFRLTPGRQYSVAVRLVDVFGNDAAGVVPVDLRR